MKKTQRKDAVRNIKKRIVSYLSICLVVMLGLGGLFTTRYLGAGLNKKAAEYYSEHDFKNYEMISSLGVSDANIEKIKNFDGVIDAEGAIQAEGTVLFGAEKRNVTVISLTKNVSAPDLTEGRFPVGKDECLLGEDFAKAAGLKVGDSIKVSLNGLSKLKISYEPSLEDEEESGSPDEEAEDADSSADSDAETEEAQILFCDTFTITGLMHHPDYFRRNTEYTVTLPLSAFNEEVTDGLYTRAFIRTEDPEDTGIFSEEYFEKTEAMTASLDGLTKELEADRAKEVIDAANAYIDEQWAEALAELDAAEAEISDGEAELDRELEKGRNELYSAEETLEDEVRKAIEKIEDGEALIEKYDKEIKDGEALIKKYDKEIKNGEALIEKYEKKIKNGEALIKKYEKKLAKAEKELKKSKKEYKAIREIYDKNFVWAAEMADDIAELAETELDEEIEPPKTEKKIAKTIIDQQLMIYAAVEYCKSDDAEKDIKKIEGFSGFDVEKLKIKKYVDIIAGLDVDALVAEAELVNDSTEPPYHHFSKSTLKTLRELFEGIEKIGEALDEAGKKVESSEKDLKNAKKQLNAKKKELNDGKQQLSAKKKELKEGKQQLSEKKQELNDGKQELSEKKQELNEGKQQLKTEKAKGEKKIREGWARYFEEKAENENKLEEAKALLSENREKAEEKLAEARAEVSDIECKWTLLDRKANAGYVDIKGNIDAINKAGVVFGILFSIITAIVCFSTLMIIIDEQKKLVGTAKAFGFHKSEVLAKYLLFGVSASVIGSILGIILAYILSSIVQGKFADSGIYQIGRADSVITVGSTVAFALLITGVAIAATVVACSDILRSPASVLMKGAVQKKKKKEKKKTSSGKGSLYSKLIIRNMLDDKARVLVTVAIVAFSCMLIGLGISLKLAYDGMMDKQVSDVNKYDLRVDMSDEITDEDKAAVVDVMKKNGTSYLPVTSSNLLYRWDDHVYGLQLICADADKIGEYYGIRDAESGEELSLPDDGILIQKRMKESYGMDVGKTLTILDTDLNMHEAEIKGTFVNYVGRTVVLSPEAYRSIFGCDNEINSYFIKLNEADMDDLRTQLLAATDDISFETNDEFRRRFESGSLLYNIIVLVTTGIAILMSFMILTNLANIYLNRKKTELSVMRVNGFSIKKTKAYLSRESLITTTAGLILGVAIGAIITPAVIKIMQQADLEFVKSFQTVAWVIAVVLEAAFSIIINNIVYRKVKDLNLRDIA